MFSAWGGGNGLFENPFREYLDYNPLFKRTNVLFGENSTWGHENNITEKRITGSVVLKRNHEKSKNVLPKAQVLYIPTHKQEENRFKDYSFNSGSDELLKWDRELIKWAKRQDIKRKRVNTAVNRFITYLCKNLQLSM